MNKTDSVGLIQHLQQEIINHKLEGIALIPGPDFSYLTGLDFNVMERPVVLIIPREGIPALILPELEKEKTLELKFEINSLFFNEDQNTWPGVFKQALVETGLESGQIGIVPRGLRYLEYDYLREAAPDLQFISAQNLLSSLRLHKTEVEIASLSEAVRIAECAMAAVLPSVIPGITEKQLASKLVGRLFYEGSDPQLPFIPIVSFGENSANPHAVPTDRALRSGDLVLFDWGARIDGYYSDITRTFVMEDVNPELEQIAKFVYDANQAGREIVKPGIPAKDVDQAVRQVIESAGYGDYFTHRTGHGLGREVHEEPYISQFEDTILEPGMVFTIEPGIYLPGRGGVRIEDNIVVTDHGSTSLTSMSRQLEQLELVE
jgi:Xaa-Pro dipeptidase